MIFIFILSGFIISQEVFDGLTLFTPLTDGPTGGGENKTILMNNQGEIINEWNHESCIATAPYLMSDSTLICPLKIDSPFLIGSAYGGKIVKYSWEGDVLWSYEYSDTNHLQHHDIEPMPNGNILFISWDRKTFQEALSAGRRDLESEMWPDKIVEVQPVGVDSALIVWEWKFWDHIIQDTDSSLANYGEIRGHPELIDINLGEMPLAPMGIADWTHLNSIDYNEDLDQILLSSRNMSEIYIIDHSTTTEEASGHSGGNSGMGGDFLFRWGNPKNYERGTISDQVIIGQHDANWIESGFPNSGNIVLYNNGATTGFGQNYTQSSILEIEPPIDGYQYYINGTEPFSPDTALWSFSGDFFSSIMSGAKRLPNGNTLVTVATEMRIFEVSTEGVVLWDYVHDGFGQTTISKASKYPLSYLSYLGVVDINGDQNSDILDVIILLGYILGVSDSYADQVMVADLNYDGDLTVEDIVSLVQILLYQ